MIVLKQSSVNPYFGIEENNIAMEEFSYIAVL